MVKHAHLVKATLSYNPTFHLPNNAIVYEPGRYLSSWVFEIRPPADQYEGMVHTFVQLFSLRTSGDIALSNLIQSGY